MAQEFWVYGIHPGLGILEAFFAIAILINKQEQNLLISAEIQTTFKRVC